MATMSARDSSAATAQESDEEQEEEQEEKEDNKKATRLYLRFAGLIDIGVEVIRMEQRIGALQTYAQTLEMTELSPCM